MLRKYGINHENGKFPKGILAFIKDYDPTSSNNK